MTERNEQELQVLETVDQPMPSLQGELPADDTPRKAEERATDHASGIGLLTQQAPTPELIRSELDADDEEPLERFASELRFRDPPVSLDPAEVIRWSTDLRERRALVLCSHSPVLLASAFHELGRVQPFQSTHKLILKRETSEKSRAFRRYCLKPTSIERDTLLVVDACTVTKAPFLDDLFADPTVGWDALQSPFEKRKRYLLVLVTPTMLAERVDLGGTIPIEDIPFALPLIRSVEPDEQRARELRAEFERQASKGDWGDSEERQCQALHRCIRERQLLEVLSTKTRPTAPEASEVKLGDDPLLDTVLFIATFFPAVAATDFQDLVLGLVGDAEDPLAPEPPPPAQLEQQPTAEGKPPSAPRDTRESTARRRTTLAERWQAQSHALLKQAGLRVGVDDAFDTQLEEGEAAKRRSSVGFTRIGQREYFANCFATEHHFSYLARFEKLRSLRVLEHPSEFVVQAFVQLAVELAAGNPQRYGTGWLLSLIVAAGPNIQNLLVEGDATAEQLAALRERLSLHQARHHFIFDRVCLLLREMLKHQALSAVVEETLDQLCRNALHDAVLEIVVRLTNTLNLDFFRWFRRVLDEGEAHVRERALGKLFWLACGTPQRGSVHAPADLTLKILLKCSEWAESSARGRPSGIAGMVLTAAVAESVLARSPFDAFDGEAPAIGIYGWLAHAPGRVDALPALTAWLLGANVKAAYHDETYQLRVIQGLFRHWFTPHSVAAFTDDDGEALRDQLRATWQNALTPLLDGDDFPGAALLQVVVLSDAAIRLAESGRIDAIFDELGHLATRKQIRTWLTLLHLLSLSIQNIELTLVRSFSRLSKEDRKRCKSIRERCLKVRDEWRALHSRLKQLRSADSPKPESESESEVKHAPSD